MPKKTATAPTQTDHGWKRISENRLMHRTGLLAEISLNDDTFEITYETESLAGYQKHVPRTAADRARTLETLKQYLHDALKFIHNEPNQITMYTTPPPEPTP
jgi:hypothetical protein